MCDGPSDQGQQAQTKMTRGVGAREAGKDLARLMERQLGYEDGYIDNIALRLFIRAHWSKVSRLAHQIHDDAE